MVVEEVVVATAFTDVETETCDLSGVTQLLSGTARTCNQPTRLFEVLL